MVLGKLPVPGRPTIWLMVGAVEVVWTFLLFSILSPLSPSLRETARYRLEYCLKGPLNPKQPTNQRALFLSLQTHFRTYETEFVLFVLENSVSPMG